MEKALDDNDQDRWLELYEQHDKLFIELSKLYGITRKLTPMERKLKKFQMGWSSLLGRGLGPIESQD